MIKKIILISWIYCKNPSLQYIPCGIPSDKST